MKYHIAYLVDHPTYVAEVAELKYAQWRHTSPDRPYQVWVEEIAHSARKGELPMTLVALQADELLGFVTLIALEEKAGVENGLWLITLYVKASDRGAGLGLQLMRRCIAEAQNLGYAALHLWTESPRLTAYYARNGWRWLGRDDGSGDDIMVYELGHPE